MFPMFRSDWIRTRIRGLSADHLRIARSAIWVSLFVLLGKSAGAMKEMAIAYRYGVGTIVDAYQLTFTLITWLPSTAVTVLGTVLIPALVRLRDQDETERANFLGELQGWSLLIGLLFAGLLYLCWGPAVQVMGGSLSPETRQMSLRLMVGMLPIGILTLWISVQAARLQSRERHVNTLLECVPAGTLFIATLLFGTGGSITPLIYGTSLGFIIQFLWLSVLARRADGIRPRLKFSLGSKEWPFIWHAAGVYMLGQVAMNAVTPLDQYFVAHLGDGMVATLGYANRVLALILGMGALAISRATLPVFSDIRTKGDHHRAREVALKWTAVMFFGSFFVVFFAGIFSEHAIRFLFQRGAFAAKDTIEVARIFRWNLVQVPFYFAAPVMLQLMASQGRFKVMASIAVLSFFVKALMNLLLVQWLDVRGIVLATAAMYASSLACYLIVALRLGRDE
ncbi:virulence factor MVIN family protein [Burkholderia pseudomultivorans]|uniref:Virulence factor MVIN family protein n=1 Tax=Burkholderia pseudomultivorans TaxID=1207504 RepID=A0A6P2K9W1_9BURK|nr:lipid II flippase MurJ [Burkholderia pseudomultivorans]VWB54036.1 virulence factor MVIN family protein [Burkholderia pseudomultivorans]